MILLEFKVYVDGQEGTTGLKIHERLAKRDDLEILKIDSDKRKDIEARRVLLNEADIVFLCLPDEASKQSVSLISNNNTKVIDASTAFRTNPEWIYGLPELSKNQRELIKNSKRVANPGCHATGVNIVLYPLIKEGIISPDYPINSYSLTGYSGGGRKLIEKYETSEVTQKLMSPQVYALSLKHKHLPEMQKVSGLAYPPIFTPIVANYYQGMVVTTPLNRRLMNKKLSAEDLHNFMSSYYSSEHFVRVMPFDPDYKIDGGFLGATDLNNTNYLDIFVFGKDDQILLISRFDNLGKGASGAAIQNMNIMLGIDEKFGIE